MPKFCIEWEQKSWGEYILEANNKAVALDNFWKSDMDEVYEDVVFGDFEIVNIYEVDEE
jgi:hypothetical protein